MTARRSTAASPAPGSRERLLRTMGKLLRRRGYAASALQEVVREAGAPVGSLYFHFPGGKEQLAAEAVARSGSRVGERLAWLLSRADAPAAVRAIAAAMGEDLRRSRWSHGCPIGSTALERAADSEPIRSAAAGVFDQWELLLVQRLCADGFDADRARRIAGLVVAMLEGALLVARTRRSVEPLLAGADLVAGWIASETPSASARDSARPGKERT